MNITLKVPDELGQRAKHYAVDARKSLSAVVTELLEQKLEASERQAEQDELRKRRALVEEVRAMREEIRREAGTCNIRELIEEGRRY